MADPSLTGDAACRDRPPGPAPPEIVPAESGDRRNLLATIGTALGLTAAYGALAAMMGRFLFPSGPPPRGWMYVSQLARLAPGDALVFQTPSGARVNVARQGDADDAEAFIALSSTCPHLGCQVHWQAQNDRFFCPCHNGIFSPDGTAVGGPPAEAGQSLPRYPLKVDRGLLYIEVDLDELARGPGRILEDPESPPGPGHDPCLFACPVDRSTARSRLA